MNKTCLLWMELTPENLNQLRLEERREVVRKAKQKFYGKMTPEEKQAYQCKANEKCRKKKKKEKVVNMNRRNAAIHEMDRRNAAIHEAGHVVICHAFGANSGAWLVQTDTTNPMYEKTWVGHALLDNILNAKAREIACVAGAVAEAIYEDANITADEIVFIWQIEPDSGPSEKDYLAVVDDMREDWDRQYEAVIEAMAVLKKQWAFLESIAGELLLHGVVSTDAVVSLGEKHMAK